MPLTLSDLAPFISPYTPPRERQANAARSFEALAQLSQNDRRIEQDQRQFEQAQAYEQRQFAQTQAFNQQKLAADKAQQAAALQYNRDKLRQDQAQHAATLSHHRDQLKQQRLEKGQELLESMFADMEPGGSRQVGEAKMRLLEQYGIKIQPKPRPAPAPPPAPPPPMGVSPQTAQAMPTPANLLQPPVQQPPNQPMAPPQQAALPTPAAALPAPQAAGGGAPQQPRPQAAPAQPPPAQPSPARPMPPPVAAAPQQPQPDPEVYEWFMDGKRMGEFNLREIAETRRRQVETGAGILAAAQPEQERGYADSLVKAAAAIGMPPQQALAWVAEKMHERSKLNADLAQNKAQAEAARGREAMADRRQDEIEARNRWEQTEARARYQIDAKRMELMQARLEATEATTRQKLDEQLRRHNQTADRVEGEIGWRHIKEISDKKEAPKTAAAIAIIDQQLRKYWANANNPKEYKAAAYAIAQARDGNKISDADVENVPNITGWFARVREWAANNFEGEVSGTEYRLMGEMMDRMREEVVLRSYQHYKELAELRDSYAPDSPQYREMDRYLLGQYNGAPFWKAQREAEGLPVEGLPPEKEPEPERPEPTKREFAPLPATLEEAGGAMPEPQLEESPVGPRGDRELPPAPDINGTLDAAGEAYGVPPEVMRAVAHVESRGNPNAVSGAGAVGLMQLMPAAASDMGVSDRRDPSQNAHGGARYLAQLIKQFGSLEKALQAYNWGPGNVQSGKPVPAEVQKYARDVLARIQVERGSNAPAQTMPASEAAPDKRAAFRRKLEEFKARNGRAPTKEEAAQLLAGE